MVGAAAPTARLEGVYTVAVPSLAARMLPVCTQTRRDGFRLGQRRRGRRFKRLRLYRILAL